jgi:hypothetical protein
MSDVRAILDSQYDATAYGEWKNKEMFDSLPEDEKVLADNLLDTFDKVGPYDETENIWVTFMKESENEDSSIGVKCENCVFYASEEKCVILAQEIEPGGRCRFVTIPPGYVRK